MRQWNIGDEDDGQGERMTRWFRTWETVESHTTGETVKGGAIHTKSHLKSILCARTSKTLLLQYVNPGETIQSGQLARGFTTLGR